MAEVAMGVGAGLSGLGGVMKTGGTVAARDVEAKSLQAEARSIDQSTASQIRAQQRQAAFAQGEANALAAASGVDVSRGSSLFLELDRAKQAELERLNLARSGQMLADSKRFSARMVRRQIPFDIIGGLGQQGSILTSLVKPGGG